MPGKLVGLLAAVALLLGLAAATSVPAGQASEQARAMPDGRVVVRKIKRYQRATWRWQRLMGVAKTPNRRTLPPDEGRRVQAARAEAVAPPRDPREGQGAPPAARASLALPPAARGAMARRRGSLLGRAPDGPLVHAALRAAPSPPPRLGEHVDAGGADVGRGTGPPGGSGLLPLAQHRPDLRPPLGRQPGRPGSPRTRTTRIPADGTRIEAERCAGRGIASARRRGATRRRPQRPPRRLRRDGAVPRARARTSARTGSASPRSSGSRSGRSRRSAARACRPARCLRRTRPTGR